MLSLSSGLLSIEIDGLKTDLVFEICDGACG